ncbi:beta-ketoacyl-[acyl-carrier-protein] synthase family protein [Brevibacillus fulvus]|uniref:3-oxoacyl-[acyl-carrier-protein] synthase II n=1 Tax=Brevibacillus fulvus TaxID=1125967 RepID=A0A938XZ49_9BACL|nr:beta-ketoacyl-[acyl-carrier-protein] synthase family protein [Brevibacillus fulvus]MBM7589559.1 3-oxoacyl-[acyl-carrier-protein] synthase II [Brevibacillus fulvus]
MKNSARAKVVVTGLGAVTALGENVETLWTAVKAGTHGIYPVESLDMSGYMTRIAGEVKGKLSDVAHAHVRQTMDRAILFATKAAEEALADAGLRSEQLPERTGCIMGTCLGGMNSGEKWFRDQLQTEQAEQELTLEWRFNSIAESLASHFELKGPIFTISTACAAGGNAIGFAADLIRQGKADVMLVGGADALAHMGVAGFHALQSLAAEPCRPYSKDRTGLSLGEGAGVLVFESEERARKRQAKIYAEVLGFGLSADGYHPTAPKPDGEGAGRAIGMALEQSGVAPEEIGYINGHGTGTVKNDSAETQAIKRVFGPAADQLKVSSTKSMIGHLLGAAGAVEGIVTVLALYEQVIPPTANYQQPDPECDLDYVPNHALYAPELKLAMSNNFAFGGNNCSVLFARYQENLSPATHFADERVLITGISQLSLAGPDLDAFWQAAVEGRNLFSRLEGEAGEALTVGKVQEFQIESYISRRDARKMDEFEKRVVSAAISALADAGIEVDEENGQRVGIIVGTANGTVESLVHFYAPLLAEGAQGANPVHFPNMVFNQASGLAATHTKAVGINTTIVDGHASLSAAMCTAFEHLKKGDAEKIVVIGADVITPEVVRAYRQNGVLAETLSLYQQNSSGFVLSEGAVALVLERETAAAERGARVYGEMSGYGKTYDGKRFAKVDPTGEGLKRAMQQALQQAKLTETDIDAVFAAANGLRPIDTMEARAYQKTFGPKQHLPYIASLKAVFGEAQGVADGFQIIGSLLSLQKGVLPRAHGAQPAARLKLVSQTTELKQMKHVLVNSCSLTGSNVSLVLSKYET